MTVGTPAQKLQTIISINGRIQLGGISEWWIRGHVMEFLLRAASSEQHHVVDVVDGQIHPPELSLVLVLDDLIANFLVLDASLVTGLRTHR